MIVNEVGQQLRSLHAIAFKPILDDLSETWARPIIIPSGVIRCASVGLARIHVIWGRLPVIASRGFWISLLARIHVIWGRLPVIASRGFWISLLARTSGLFIVLFIVASSLIQYPINTVTNNMVPNSLPGSRTIIPNSFTQ